MKLSQRFFGVLFLSVFLMGCEEERQAANDVEYLQKAALEISNLSPAAPSKWKTEERDLLEKYFRTLAFWVQSAEKNKGAKVLPSGANCRSFFVERTKWKELTQYCQSGSLYLCTDEMRNYESLLSRAGKVLSDCKDI